MLESMLENLRWGVAAGLFFAALYSLYVTLLYLIRGPDPFDANETTLGQVIAVYFAGGIAGGAIVGVLRPLAKWRIGAAVVGVVAAVPVFLGIALSLEGGLSGLDRGAWEAVAFCSIFFGILGGNAMWRGGGRKRRLRHRRGDAPE